jgi:hypothetical protein
MTGTYPLDFCWETKKNKKEEEFIDEDGVEEMEASAVPSTVKMLLEKVDPDAWCLPFWAGFFVLGSQLFIYTLVIANVFFRNTIPPNADTWLRLAQVS